MQNDEHGYYCIVACFRHVENGALETEVGFFLLEHWWSFTYGTGKYVWVTYAVCTVYASATYLSVSGRLDRAGEIP